MWNGGPKLLSQPKGKPPGASRVSLAVALGSGTKAVEWRLAGIRHFPRTNLGGSLGQAAGQQGETQGSVGTAWMGL